MSSAERPPPAAARHLRDTGRDRGKFGPRRVRSPAPRCCAPATIGPAGTPAWAQVRRILHHILCRFCEVVGAARFELTTPCTQNRCATRLRHTPTVRCSYRPAGLRRKPLRSLRVAGPCGARLVDGRMPDHRPLAHAEPRHETRVDLEHVLRRPVAGQRGLVHRNGVLPAHSPRRRWRRNRLCRERSACCASRRCAPVHRERRRACPPVAASPRRTSDPCARVCGVSAMATWNRALPQSPRSSTRSAPHSAAAPVARKAQIAVRAANAPNRPPRGAKAPITRNPNSAPQPPVCHAARPRPSSPRPPRPADRQGRSAAAPRHGRTRPQLARRRWRTQTLWPCRTI
jgi:hypothetical protein